MILKRVFDLTLTLLFAPFWLGIGCIIFLLVRVKLGTPVFFSQARPGLDGCLFKLIKFRSMTDSRDVNGNLLPDEQRLTAFGKWLRSTSLDELPELLNVIKGEMSLVGPRPLLVQYLPLYSERQMRRHELLPGITGWAQINGRNALSWEEKLELDVWYIEHRSFRMDVLILARTILKVFGREGINTPGSATAPFFTGSSGREKTTSSNARLPSG